MTAALRIIIVEDDVLIAMDMAELLLGLGYDVCATACTEAQALAAAIRHQPDLMIVDANLAQGSGPSAMAGILAHSVVPYLYVTGDPVGLALLAPDAVVLTKPFTLRELTDGIARALAKCGRPMDSAEAKPPFHAR